MGLIESWRCIDGVFLVLQHGVEKISDGLSRTGRTHSGGIPTDSYGAISAAQPGGRGVGNEARRSVETYRLPDVVLVDQNGKKVRFKSNLESGNVAGHSSVRTSAYPDLLGSLPPVHSECFLHNSAFTLPARPITHAPSGILGLQALPTFRMVRRRGEYPFPLCIRW